MEWFFIIVLLLALIAVGVVLIIQFFKHKREKLEWEREAQEKCSQLNSELNEYIRNTYDNISDNSKDYENKSEREILMDVIMALATYGRRIDRIDDKLDGIYNYKSYIDSMNSQAQKVAEFYVALSSKTTEIESVIANCRNTIHNVSRDINELNQHFGNTINLEKDIRDCVRWMDENTPRVNWLIVQTNRILQDLEKVVSTWDSSPATKLKNIETITEKTNVLVRDSLAYTGSNSIYSKFEMLNKNLVELKSHLSKIEKAVDEYGYNSLYSKIDEIKSEIDDLKTYEVMRL